MARSADEHVRDTSFDDAGFDLPDEIPLLPVRDAVVFPNMTIVLEVERPASIAAVDHAAATDRLLFIDAQKDMELATPEAEDLFGIGTLAVLLRGQSLPEGRRILVQGLRRARLGRVMARSNFMSVAAEILRDSDDALPPIDIQALLRNVKELFPRIAGSMREIGPEFFAILRGVESPGMLADIVAGTLGLPVPQAQDLLETRDVGIRLEKVYDLVLKELELLDVRQRIKTATEEKMGKSQREYYLREQLKTIHHELGDDEETGGDDELRERLLQANLPELAAKEAHKQLGRLGRLHPDSPESGVIRTYLEWMADLPWSVVTDDSLDIANAQKILDEDHYDLEKVKERILEFLSVHKLKKKLKGPILCFVGPPGVGKTSLGKSIARAMGRNFVRLSLGGVRDEAEIRGHRRTYIGAMPGRILQALKQAGSRNPVFILDEIDKLGSDYRGSDPYSAMLEVLDPEQNHSFSDHYINVPFDLSDVMFIATANMMDTIPGPLRDRMEIIELSGYTEEEKLRIAEKYLIPRQIAENGLTEENVTFTDGALRIMVEKYTREAGLRNIERKIGMVCRKIARRVAEQGDTELHVIDPETVEGLLGRPVYLSEQELEEDAVGTVTGLAWTPAGGEILFIEATVMQGAGTLNLTGSLGDVMKESAEAALSYIRSNAALFDIPEKVFSESSIHIHVPAGAMPKDGPSAGVTMATALLSALTRTPVNREVAMTGEITLRGRVLPIGGLKEKVLGAVRAGIRKVVIPEYNALDLEDIPQEIRNRVEIVPVKMVDEVFRAALVGLPAHRGEGAAVPPPAVVRHPEAETPAIIN